MNLVYDLSPHKSLRGSVVTDPSSIQDVMSHMNLVYDRSPHEFLCRSVVTDPSSMQDVCHI